VFSCGEDVFDVLFVLVGFRFPPIPIGFGVSDTLFVRSLGFPRTTRMCIPIWNVSASTPQFQPVDSGYLEDFEKTLGGEPLKKLVLEWMRMTHVDLLNDKWGRCQRRRSTKK
jgi:hypothetical protein